MIIQVDYFKDSLNDIFNSFTELLGNIRIHYSLDESWDGSTNIYFSKEKINIFEIFASSHELLLRCNDIHHDIKEALINNEAFKNSEIICKYNEDICQMVFSINNNTSMNKLFEFIHFMKPVERTFDLSNVDMNEIIIGRCGNLCSSCLMHGSKNVYSDGRKEYQVRDHDCFHYEGKPIVDYHGLICLGCKRRNNQNCSTIKCLEDKKLDTCFECDYNNCINMDTHIGDFDPGRTCNIGVTAEDIEKVILPYCCKQRYSSNKLLFSKMYYNKSKDDKLKNKENAE